jgi:hypothetical protein
VTNDAASSGRQRILGATVVTVAVTYSFVAGHFATFTRPAAVATFVPGLLAVIIAARTAPRSKARPGRSRAGWLAWGLIATGVTVVELVTLASGADNHHPTISDLVNPWLLPTLGRTVAFAAWLALGYWLARR